MAAVKDAYIRSLEKTVDCIWLPFVIVVELDDGREQVWRMGCTCNDKGWLPTKEEQKEISKMLSQGKKMETTEMAKK